MHVSARTDYAVRAMLALAAVAPDTLSAPTLAVDQDIPLGFLHAVLADLRRAGLVYSQRGVVGGYGLLRPAGEVTVGDVLRATGGTLVTVRGLPPDVTDYPGVAGPLREVWLATQLAIRDVVDKVSLADLVPAHQLR